MARRTLAWSYSRLKSFEACPKQVELRGQGIPEVMSGASDRGTRIHADAEEFLQGKHRQVPATLQGFKSEFQALKRKKAKPEEKIAVTEEWEVVDWRSPRTWLRVVVDANFQVRRGVHAVIDFKTGREYPDHLDQMELYALVFFKLRSVHRVEGELWYLDQSQIIHDLFTRSQVSTMEEKWRTRVQPYTDATEFPATPGPHCRWCGFASAKGGPCRKDQE